MYRPAVDCLLLSSLLYGTPALGFGTEKVGKDMLGYVILASRFGINPSLLLSYMALIGNNFTFSELQLWQYN